MYVNVVKGIEMITIEIGNLITLIEKYKNITLENNKEVNIDDLGIEINTPSGLTQINYIIKKETDGLKITFDNGYILECAENHILHHNGKNIFAKDLNKGDFIELFSKKFEPRYLYHPVIEKIESIGLQTFYDISIASPHLYYDSNGFCHHNTLMTATLSHIVEPYGRTIVIVPNKDLVKQTEEDYKNLGLDVGVYFGERKEYNKTHTICTWQSLAYLDKKTKNQIELKEKEQFIHEFLDGVVCVMCDECHTANGTLLKNLLTGPMENVPIRWGLTGTVPLDDYITCGLISSIGPILGKLSASELQEKNILSNCHINILQTQEVLSFDTYDDERKYLVTNNNRLQWVADKVLEIKDTGNTLVLCNNIETGKKLLNLIPDSVFISGSTKSNDRKAEYDKINEMDNQVIIATFGVASTGINLPRIFNLVFLEAGKSFTKVIQSVGRGLRKAKDKDHVEIYDICSKCKYSARHLTNRKKFYKAAEYPFNVKKEVYKY